MQSRKRKEEHYTKKLTDFFTMLVTDREKWQDGTGREKSQASSSYTDLPDDNLMHGMRDQSDIYPWVTSSQSVT